MKKGKSITVPRKQVKPAARVASPSPEHSELKAVLKDCAKAAKRGYAIAQENVSETEDAVSQAEARIKETLKQLAEFKIETKEVVADIKRQLTKVMSDLRNLQTETEVKLKERRALLAHFNVSLFGRTMAGKSTLMEILTRGDGASIGKGGQRTTRDVRQYEWNGLRITDVPGVAAFEGIEDEELAYEAAAQADFILFLITDDSPQDAEAQCLARVKGLGKPILGVCNVKAACKSEDDLELFLHNPGSKFREKDLEDIRRQFLDLANRYAPGLRIPFVYVHLESRFLADSPGMADRREQLIGASRFDQLESRLIDQISNNGSFYRIKTFIDASVVPMLDLSITLLDFRHQNSSKGRSINENRKKLVTWTEEFRNSGNERILAFIRQVESKLNAVIPSFAEDNYERKDAGKRWNTRVESFEFSSKAEQLMKDLSKEAEQQIQDVMRELQAELSLVGSIQAEAISMSSLTDSRRWVRWGTVVISGCLTIAAIFVSGPIGWVAAGVALVGGLLSYFMDSKDKKASKAKKKLSESLEKSVSKIAQSMRKHLQGWFFQNLLDKHVYQVLNSLSGVISAVFSLADTQRDLAELLIQRQKSLNRLLVTEALEFKGISQWDQHIHAVARVPGFGSALLIQAEVKLPDTFRRDLESLLGERVFYVKDTGSDRSLIYQLLKHKLGEGSNIRIEEKIRVAHVPLKSLDEEGRQLALLGQQLTGLHVIP